MAEALPVLAEAPAVHTFKTTRRALLVLAFLFLTAHAGTREFQWQSSCTTASNSVSTLKSKNISTTSEMIITEQERVVTNESIHVLFGLSGNAPGFLEEVQVALKSVLLNAPVATTHSSLTIHIMADDEAYQAISSLLVDDKSKMNVVKEWVSRNPIRIEIYNIQSHLQDWKERIQTGMHQFQFDQITTSHTLGTYYRLFAHDVLPIHTVQHVLYMDSDAVLLANLQSIWAYRKDNTYFTWGREQCAGFLLLNIQKLEELWNLTATLDLQTFSTTTHTNPSDQMILRAIHATYPQRVGLVPPPWDISFADGIWQHKYDLTQARPEAGMLHFNGGKGSKQAYFREHESLRDDNPQKDALTPFRVALYYQQLPWGWARFIAQSMIPVGEKGYLLQIQFHNIDDHSNANSTNTASNYNNSKQRPIQ